MRFSAAVFPIQVDNVTSYESNSARARRDFNGKPIPLTFADVQDAHTAGRLRKACFNLEVLRPNEPQSPNDRTSSQMKVD
jgi:hypothetical protein